MKCWIQSVIQLCHVYSVFEYSFLQRPLNSAAAGVGLDALREACPDAEIFVESMLPLDKAIASKANCPNRVIRAFNGRVEALAAEYGMPYLDIYPAYEDRGGLNSAMTEDGIHLKDDAFGPWAEIVRPYLEP